MCGQITKYAKAMNIIIVSRHKAAVDWVKKHHPDLVKEEGDDILMTMAHVSAPSVLEGARVIGNLPCKLAALCGEYWEIEMDLPADARGRELTVEDMEKFGAKLIWYVVFPADGSCPFDIIGMSSIGTAYCGR